MSQVVGKPTGWYCFKIEGENVPVFLDMEYTSVPMVLVMANNEYTGGMTRLRYVDAVNRANYRKNGSSGSDLRNGTNEPGWHISGKSKPGLDDVNVWIGLKFWKFFGGRVRSGKISVRQFVANIKGAPLGSNQSTHEHRAGWYFDGFNTSTWAFENSVFESVYTGGTNPGLYSSHSKGQPLTTFDNDNDTAGGNCATFYDDNPWWYTSCWSGSMWGSTTASSTNNYHNRAYWTGSAQPGGHAYGAVYIG
jgi:hypothetical protein